MQTFRVWDPESVVLVCVRFSPLDLLNCSLTRKPIGGSSCTVPVSYFVQASTNKTHSQNQWLYEKGLATNPSNPHTHINLLGSQSWVLFFTTGTATTGQVGPKLVMSMRSWRVTREDVTLFFYFCFWFDFSLARGFDWRINGNSP